VCIKKQANVWVQQRWAIYAWSARVQVNVAHLKQGRHKELHEPVD
jgi:hypothetical protein